MTRRPALLAAVASSLALTLDACNPPPPGGSMRSTQSPCAPGERSVTDADGGVRCEPGVDAAVAPDVPPELAVVERDLPVVDRDVPTIARDVAMKGADAGGDAGPGASVDAATDGARDATPDLVVSDASAPLVTGLGGAAGFGAECLHPNDDGSWAGPMATTASGARPIDLTRVFPEGLNLGGANFRAMYVNTNGNVTFRAAFATFTPMAFPFADQPMIAPWWADVDTRGGGQPMRNNVCFALEAARVVVTWHLVGYYNSHDDLQNSVQLILSRPAAGGAPTDFDVEFRYHRCQWTTGDASGGMRGLGGTPAQAGFDLGDRRTALTLPSSRTPQVLTICNTSNVGMPGVWRFRARGGVVASE